MSKSTTINSGDYQRLEIAIGDEKTVDVFFVFNGVNRCTRIASHKSILSSKSDVFLTMFSDNWKQTLGDDITITDATAEHFIRFLRTFYDDKILIKNISNQNVCEMLYLAHKYNAKHCIDACGKFLLSTLNGNNALHIMELSLLYGMEELSEKCSFEIAADCYGIIDTAEFYTCSPNVLERFLENIEEDDFCCDNYSSIPVEICRACMRWAQRRCIDQNIDPNKPGALRSQLNDFFQNIPFMFMKRDEFHDFLADYAEIFTVSEIKCICSRM